jgi:hypothetical protein
MKTATDEAASTLLSMQTMATPPSSPKTKATPEGTPPTKFNLKRMKRNSDECIELVYVGDDSVTEIVVPVRPGDTKETVGKRQKLYALLEQERDIRVTAYCVWKREFVSFRFNRSAWKGLVFGPNMERYCYEHVQLVVVRTNCKQRNDKPPCKGCSVDKACEDEAVYRYLLPHPKVNGKHVLCDAALCDMSALAVDGKHDAKAEYHKHIPTCAVSS